MYFLASDTVDDILWPLVQAKAKVLGEIVEGSGVAEIAVVGSKSIKDGIDDFEMGVSDEKKGDALVGGNSGDGVEGEVLDGLDEIVKEIAVESKRRKANIVRKVEGSSSSAGGRGGGGTTVIELNSDDDGDDFLAEEEEDEVVVLSADGSGLVIPRLSGRKRELFF